MNFPPEVRSAEFDVVYDPALVSSIDRGNPAEADSGRTRLRLNNPSGQGGAVNAAFRVTAKAGGTAQLSFENISATGEGGVALSTANPDVFAVTIVP